TAFPYAIRELALCFFERISMLLSIGGTSALVLPGEWTYVRSNRKFRENLLKRNSVHALSRLGVNSFVSGIRANPILIIASNGHSNVRTVTIDVSNLPFSEKALGLVQSGMDVSFQEEWENQVDFRLLSNTNSVVDDEEVEVGIFCDARNGMSAGDG